jgi:hypothetical protein
MRIAWATLLFALPAAAATLQVGPTRTYTAPCTAIAVAQANDVIEIDAGTYSGDVCQWSTNGLTLRGVGGLAHLDAAGMSSQGKAIWVISGNDTTVENIEFSGATVVDMNGAGIRQEGVNLTVRGSYFHDNQDGILAGDNAASTIRIETSEFDHNGAGDGMSHNMYINHVGTFVLYGCWTHNANVGHLVKSRAAVTQILYNRISDEMGTASYEIDLPNGGTAFVIGNLIEQGPNTQNSTILNYGEEGTNPANPGTDLYVVNNTFVNDRPNGGTFVSLAAFASPAVLTNDVFFGPGTVTDQAGALQTTNFTMDPQLVSQANIDYHLGPTSPCINAGSDPGMGGGMALAPTMQYVHPAAVEPRLQYGPIDIGAYELVQFSTGDDIPIPDGFFMNRDLAVPPGADLAVRGDGAGASDGGAGGAGTGGCGCALGARAPSLPVGIALALLALVTAWRGRRR